MGFLASNRDFDSKSIAFIPTLPSLSSEVESTAQGLRGGAAGKSGTSPGAERNVWDYKQSMGFYGRLAF